MSVLKLVRAARDDRGSAMAAVMGAMLVLGLVSVTVLSSVVASTAFTTSTRADTQSQASADAGVDALFAQISVGTFACAGSSSTAPIYSASVQYYNAAGNLMPCTTTVSGTPAKAVITSTGTAQAKGVGATSGDAQTVIATVAIQTDSTTTALDKAVFSEGSFTLSNNVTINDSVDGTNDGDLYSNGTINCGTQLQIQGDIIAQGDLRFENTCEGMGTIWVGGNATFSSSVDLTGSLYAAGTGTITVANSSHIKGGIVTNGSVILENKPQNSKQCPGNPTLYSVCGTVVALGGSITTKNGSNIGGSAYSKTGFYADNANSTKIVAYDVVTQSGTVAGSNLSGTTIGGTVRTGGTIGVDKARIGTPSGSCQGTADATYTSCGGTPAIPAPNPAQSYPAGLGYPANLPTLPAVNKPLREELPRIENSATGISKWSGWTPRYFTGANACTDAKTYINGTWSGKQLVVIDGCSAPLSWNNEDLVLKGDLAIMSTSGFAAANQFKVKSSVTGTSRDLFWMVPSNGPGITWSTVAGTSPAQTAPSCTTGGNVIIDNQVTITDTRWFIYSPCKVEMKNTVSGFKGQIYAGSVSYPNNSALTFAKLTVPSATSSVSTNVTYSAQLLSRLDQAGS